MTLAIRVFNVCFGSRPAPAVRMAAIEIVKSSHAMCLRQCRGHACGYALANKGHDTLALQAYLGHKNIQHTVRYTELSPTRFKDFWGK
jgi:type 1 fimbriae regulatory protein FimB/type 1 fimbriae regulatory protein FimE